MDSADSRASLEKSGQGNTLVLRLVTGADSGLYTCSADNGSGKPATAKVQLDVLHKPEIEPEQVFIHTKDGAVMDPSMNVMTRRGNRHSLLIQKIGETEIHGKY